MTYVTVILGHWLHPSYCASMTEQIAVKGWSETSLMFNGGQEAELAKCKFDAITFVGGFHLCKKASTPIEDRG